MKRINMILVAFALVLIMTQCKKNEETNQSETVTITLDAKRTNGSRVDVNTATGTVDFEAGDKVYVGSGGKYVGFLTHNGTNFVGNITNPTENQPLQFYFLGNVTPQETLTASTTEECSVIISDQTDHLPVISCAASYENYVSGVTSYTGNLLNKCALVKFNVMTPSNSPICITGMHNKVKVDFTQNTVTPSIDGEGVIMLPAGSGENVEKWAILLPQEALGGGEEGSIYSEDGLYSGTRPVIPEITENGYLAEGITLRVDVGGVPVGAINGLFSVSDTKQVYFSKGNLQFIGSASTPYWKFAENQWDCLGNNGQGSAYLNVDRDLFGWGTSGYNHGAVCYHPWSTSTDNSSYYAYGSPTANLDESTGQADWGYNAISNGGNQMNQWRTLSQSEWNYVLNSRYTESGSRFARAEINGITGLVLFPDDWSNSIIEFNNINPSGADWYYNVIDASVWTNALEINGAIFLPYTWARDGNNILQGINYWTSSYGPMSGLYNAENSAYSMRVYGNGIDNGFIGVEPAQRSKGFAVRLVQDN